MCAFKIHIKLSIFKNNFFKIEKTIIIFLILKKKISKIEINKVHYIKSKMDCHWLFGF